MQVQMQVVTCGCARLMREARLSAAQISLLLPVVMQSESETQALFFSGIRMSKEERAYMG